MSRRRPGRLSAHQNWAREPKAGYARPVNFTRRRERTLRPVDTCDVGLSSTPFVSLSLVLHLLGHFLHFWKGWTLSLFTVSLPVSFPPARPARSSSDGRFHGTIKNDLTVRGEGILSGVIPKEADEHKKSESTKMNNQTNKQPNEKPFVVSSFEDELLLELPVPLVAPGATAFLTLFVFPFFSRFSFVSPRIIPPPSLASTALWLQVAHPRVELTALQCTKRAS